MSCSSLRSRSGSPQLRPEKNLRVRTSALAGVAAAFVTAFAAPGAWAQAPNIALTPGENHPNSTIQVTGAHFGAYQPVDIYFDTTDEALAVTNGNGQFAKIPIPVSASALPGTHYVTAIERNNDDASQKPFTVSTDWAQSQFDQKKKGYNPYENVIGTGNVSSLDVDWTYQTGLQDDFVDVVTDVDGTVYGHSYQGQVFALNDATGALIWADNLGAYGYNSVAVSGGNVFSCTGSTLYDLAASTGQTVWTAPLLANCLASPALANGTVFVADETYPTTLYAFSAASGALLWETSFQDSLSNPAVGNGMVYVSTGSSVFALNASDGSTAWSYTVSGGISYVTPAVADGYVFIATNSGYVVALDATYGYAHWNKNFSSEGIVVTPAVAPSPYGTLLYFADEYGNMFAVKAASGALQWQSAAATNNPQSPVVANGVLYLADYDTGTYAYDALTGDLYWGASNYEGPPPIVTNGMVYVGGYNGLNAYAINGGNDKLYNSHPKRPKFSSLHPDYSLKPAN